MRLLLILAMTIFAFGKEYDLGGLIDHADKYNKLNRSGALQSKAKQKEVEAQESAYWPTLDLGASYANNNPNPSVSPGETTQGFASVGFDLYDGGRNDALTRAKSFEYHASLFQQEASRKSIMLEIIQNYYMVKVYQSNLYSLEVESKELKAQIDRIRRFEGVGLATPEEVSKLQAVYDDNAYMIENTKLELRTREEQLWLGSGVKGDGLRSSRFAEPSSIAYEPLEKTKILKSNADALSARADALKAGYMPQVRIEDTYLKSNYDDIDRSGIAGGFLVEEQNRLMVSARMRLFDNGSIKHEKEGILYQKMAVDEQKLYAQDEQKMNFDLARSRLQTIRAKLKSAKSALSAARSTYRSIVKQFEVGMVDNIAYLDALKKQTISEARYKATQYDYEIAKSIYYFYAGKNPRGYIR